MERSGSGSLSGKNFDATSTYDNKKKPLKKIGRIFLIKRIGSGSFGTVYLGYDKNEDKFYAVKRANFKELCRLNGGLNQLEREIRMMRAFDHKNILKLYEVYKAKNKPYVYLVMEYADCGSLYELTDGSKPINNEANCACT